MPWDLNPQPLCCEACALLLSDNPTQEQHLFFFTTAAVARAQSVERFFKEGWTLKPLAVNKIINMGPANGQIIDLAQIICMCDVITLFIYLHCDIIRQLPVQIMFGFF